MAVSSLESPWVTSLVGPGELLDGLLGCRELKVVVGLQGCLADVRERKTSAGKTIRGSDELPEWSEERCMCTLVVHVPR